MLPTTSLIQISSEKQASDTFCTCSCERAVGIAIGTLILVEGIITAVIVIIIVLCKLVLRYVKLMYSNKYYYVQLQFNRRKKSDKSGFAVSANMAYGEVKLGTLDGEYEDHDKLARSGRGGRGGGNYEPTGCPAPCESPVSKPDAPVYYATADDTIH